MKIGLINPNTTVAMTEEMVRSAQSVTASTTTILGLTPSKGPAALESFCDEVYAAPQVLDLIVANPGLDGYVIACANDPGLYAARELLRSPVVGIGEAGYLFASTLAQQFSVVTTLDRAVGQVWDQLARYGLRDRCCSVRACSVAVLDTTMATEASVASVLEASRLAVTVDGAEAIVLGCGGLGALAARLTEELAVPVIDGVAAATALVEGLVRCGLSTTGRGTFRDLDENDYSEIADPGAARGPALKHSQS